MAASDPIPTRYQAPDGVILRGEAAGPEGAPTVVLLHGGGQTRNAWSAERRLLVADGYRVINYDARGHGESDWSPTGDYSVPTLAADLLVVLRSISGPVALVGASMGGMTSFYAIGSSKGPVAEALVLVDIAPHAVQKGVQRIIDFMTANPDGFANLDEAAEAVAAYNPQRPRSRDASGLMNNLRLRDNGRLYWHWDPQLLQEGEGRAEAIGAHAERVAAGVTLPALLVRGGKSELIDDESVRRFKSLLPHLEVMDVAGTGHMVAGDDNSRFHSGIIGFLKRNLPS